MSLWSHFLDWIYPPQCALCCVPLRGGRHLCPRCAAQLKRLPASRCLTCAHPVEADIPSPPSCFNCISLKPSFHFATAAIAASDDSLALIHQFKLIKRPELGSDLACLAATAFRADPRFTSLPNPILIPVPLHRRRLDRRGFNQSEELARHLSRLLTIPTLRALKRVIDTPRQATLTRKQRLQNLNKAFQLRSHLQNELLGKDPILIDDVFTTGSTVNECARALQKAKPACIAVLTVVRA